MSRLPGLQYPVPQSGQPQTRGQQRPGENLLARMFQMKADKLNRQGQEFQEQSFADAQQAFDRSIDTYEQNKAAFDANEAQRYTAAQSRYDRDRAAYDSLLNQYNADVDAYEQAVSQNSQQTNLQNRLLALRDNRNNFSLANFNGQTVLRNNNNPSEQYTLTSPEGRALQASAGTIQSQLAPITTQLPKNAPSFSGTLPTFSYTAQQFASPVPSFNYTAPETPGAKNVSKLNSLSFIASQLQQAQPENSRNRAAQSYYSMFAGGA